MIKDYNENEFNHYADCRSYELSKAQSKRLTHYVTKEKQRAEEAEAKAKIHADAVKSLSEIRDELEAFLDDVELRYIGDDWRKLMRQTNDT